MKKEIKIAISIIITIAVIFILQTKVEAKSYYIENMDIKATLQESGDLEIEQTLEYSFNGDYNGIYITIPTEYENNEEIRNKINDSLYNASGVVLESVKEIRKTGEVEYKLTRLARNGDYGVYTETEENDVYELKLYSPSVNENKTFKVKYTLKNVAVKHRDIGELYYNFIGGEWQCTIKKLLINIWLPYNTAEIRAWGHGPDNGQLEIVDNTHVRLKVSNVATGKYVAGRVIFDNSNIPNAIKESGINAHDLIFEDEYKIAKISDAKKQYTRNIYIFALALLIYWIILLIKYEKDKKYVVTNINEEELFQKYNPMLAGCFQGSRDILARDILAVILNLIEKKIIQLDIRSKMDKKENYSYILNKVPEKEAEMDEIEKYVYDWLFGSRTSIELTDALEDMPKDKNASQKFKEKRSSKTIKNI